MNILSIPPLQRRNFRRGLSQRGISLIETMVGLTLGMLVVVVILQVWGVFEDQKSRSVSGSSAQESGLLAITQIEQDVRSAGAGLTDSAAFDCTTTYSYYESPTGTASPAPAYSVNMSMVPVQITDGGAGSDTLTVKRGSDFLGALPATITKTMPSSSSELNLSTVAGFADGDVVIAVDSATGNCTVMMVTQVQGAALKLQHNPGGTTTYNPAVSYQNAINAPYTAPWPAYSTGAKILKVGQLISHTYTTNSSNNLVLTDLSNPAGSVTSILASDIVKLKAQYGVATTVGGQTVDDWVSATAATGWNVLDAEKVRKIKAVRLVIAARSSKIEISDIQPATTNCPSGVVNYGPCAWPDTAADPAPVIDLRSDSNWRRYRYRVYQTIIPIRNVIWAGV